MGNYVTRMGGGGGGGGGGGEGGKQIKDTSTIIVGYVECFCVIIIVCK